VIPIAIRLGRPSDLAYVVDTWVKRGHERNERLREATARVRSLLARPETVLRVACLPDDSDAILGWAVVSFVPSPKLHYVYVRKEARNQGIARRLLVGVNWSGKTKG
jgi:ribosomal protein S18 acetylase RimI-like enzyme